jgi:thioredoxin reductase/NAD-dependent dihydropyrimidine dehydrogenase PreA subunit
MDKLIEWGIYGVTFLVIALVLLIYILKQRRESKRSGEKIVFAKEENLYEPVSIYPYIDPDRCFKSGACAMACPETDVLGIRHGRAVLINASHCIGHGACLKACPVEAISLRIGTEKRGIDLPNLNPNFETNIKGIFVAGELGGMGLIRNAVIQGKEAVDNIFKSLNKSAEATYDLIVVGAGPAGISATLQAKKLGMSVLTLEQDTLGGTVYTFPRSKIVMTAPMDLPTYGKVKMKETSKTELLDLWHKVLKAKHITIQENTKVNAIESVNGTFHVKTFNGESYTCRAVLLAIGRRGSPRKLHVPGEDSEKVAYRLLEPEEISGKRIVVVGGGDSAIESALLLADKNEVILSYRGEAFNRIKAGNARKISEAIKSGLVPILFNSNLVSIDDHRIRYKMDESDEIHELDNDLVFIFAGGELPIDFLKKVGINFSTKRGETILKN